MPKPILMSYDDWLRDTSVAKWHGRSDHDRSQELQNVVATLARDGVLQMTETPEASFRPPRQRQQAAALHTEALRGPAAN